MGQGITVNSGKLSRYSIGVVLGMMGGVKIIKRGGCRGWIQSGKLIHSKLWGPIQWRVILGKNEIKGRGVLGGIKLVIDGFKGFFVV